MDIKLKPININFQNLTYTVSIARDKKQILKGISGTFKSGDLTAIMGPSGAGKSSLLNILTGFTRANVDGVVQMNNIPLGSKKYSKLCSYILQEDNLYPGFTVYESMLLAANLKIADISHAEKNIIIENILNTLHLLHSKKTKCGNLSGGQRKRLSIALELLDNPPVLFLDEPTTGLDSSSSAYCVQMLNNLAREGRTIICTIHQPSAAIYDIFDQVYVMAEGYCVYKGSPANTLSYLSSNGLNCPVYHNVADFLVEVANGDYGSVVSQLSIAADSPNNNYEKEPIVTNVVGATNETSGKKTPTIEMKTMALAAEPLLKGEKDGQEDGRCTYRVPSEWSKFCTLVGRCQIQYFRDWTVTHLKLLLHILCASLIGLLYGDSGSNANKAIENVGFLMVGVAYLWYTTVMPGVLKFPTEIAVIRKETFNNWYRIRTYFLAVLLTTTPIHIVFSIVYSTIVFLLTDQPLEMHRYTRFTIVYVLLTLSADGFGLCLGACANPVNGTFFAAVITAFKLAFCGFLALWNHMPKLMVIFTYMSTHSWTLEALVLSVYDNGRNDTICPEDKLYCHYKSSKTILRELGMKATNYDFDVSMMLLHLIVFKTIAYILLKRRLKTE